MKRICAVLLFVLTILVMTSCGKKIEVAYYDKTEIPTFTCVTGIDKDRAVDEIGLGLFYYYTGFEEKDIEEYVSFLKKNGFSDDGVEKKEHDIVLYELSNNSGQELRQTVCICVHDYNKDELIIWPLAIKK